MKLKELRLNCGLTQEEMAQKYHLTRATYSNYENGTTQPDIKLMVQIADDFKISMDYLIGREFPNDIGYLTDDQRKFVKAFLQLDEIGQAKALGYVLALG